MKALDWMRYILILGSVCVIFAFLFYDSAYMLLVVIPLAYPVLIRYKKHMLSKRQAELSNEFRISLDLMVTALSAGYSVEGAFYETYKQLKNMFSNSNYITKEYSNICNKLALNEPIEDLIRDLANRSGIKEIKNLSEVFHVGKRTGVDIAKVMRDTSDVLSQRLMDQNEILTMIEAKRFEGTIMKIIPIMVIAYFKYNSGYMKVMYHNLFGIVFMTVVLLVYLLCCFWITRIQNI